MEQLTSTVGQNADNARVAQTLTESAHSVTARGSQIVGDVVIPMTEIDRSSQKIAEITGVIEGIAFQTIMRSLVVKLCQSWRDAKRLILARHAARHTTCAA